ncbi:hypothetical protein CDAR_260491 [Caerostris darwini]|uniref:Uncharacterized protein n=1 Tax=Caerostris darwini TaxID=1538125 RepID=A0AAV4NSB8_9ARAC|nr:hypothetical protein CDAR_260491 [Caerostris darwini]
MACLETYVQHRPAFPVADSLNLLCELHQLSVLFETVKDIVILMISCSNTNASTSQLMGTLKHRLSIQMLCIKNLQLVSMEDSTVQ